MILGLYAMLMHVCFGTTIVYLLVLWVFSSQYLKRLKRVQKKTEVIYAQIESVNNQRAAMIQDNAYREAERDRLLWQVTGNGEAGTHGGYQRNPRFYQSYPPYQAPNAEQGAETQAGFYDDPTRVSYHPGGDSIG